MSARTKEGLKKIDLEEAYFGGDRDQDDAGIYDTLEEAKTAYDAEKAKCGARIDHYINWAKTCEVVELSEIEVDDDNDEISRELMELFICDDI